MPKGDRDALKADIEDGYTKIANLLLEALAMCKINGTQKSMCLFLFRRTYGWGKSEDAISLNDFAAACDTSGAYISRQIKDLLQKNIIKRVSYEPGKTPVYTFNTKIDEWDNGCIDVQKLSESAKEGLYYYGGVIQSDKGYPIVQGLSEGTKQPLSDQTRVGLSDCARVNQPPSLEPPQVEPPLKKDLKKIKERSTTSTTTTTDRTPYKEIVDLYHSTCSSLLKVRTISANRKKHIKARYEQYKQNIEIFQELFKKAEESDFLTGREKSSNPKYRNFQADFDWLMNEHNMSKVLEDKYVNRIRGEPQSANDAKRTEGGANNAGKYSDLVLT